MEIRKYRFGDIIFQISSPISLKKDRRFEAFQTTENLEPDCSFVVVPRKMEAGASPVQIRRSDGTLTVELEEDLVSQITVANLLSVAEAPNMLPDLGCFIMHCAYVLHEGEALLFCAPSGTGKSTQAALWQRCRHAKIVNEDRALIIFREEKAYACGCWATGSARICENLTAPIRAVILLGQGEENRVFSLRPSEKLRRIVPQTSFESKDPAQCRKIIELVSDLVERVTIFGYDCIKEETAVEELEKNL